MKAITITQESEPLQFSEVPKPVIDEGECLIKLSASALNRRDQWIREGMYPGISYGTTLGSDGCGEVVEGPKSWLGKMVIINPNNNWGNNPEVQSTSYTVLGMPKDGTLAEFIKVPTHRVHLKPQHLSVEEAAALPLAGLTAFRATIKKGLAEKGKKLLVTGAGGGVSQYAIDFALTAGAEVYVTSGEATKMNKVIDRGVSQGFNYKNESWVKEAGKIGGFDAIVDSAGGNQMNNYLKLIKPGGRIILYGSTTGYPEKVDVFRLFWSQAQIMGSTMGSDAEFKEMIDWTSKYKIKPTVDQVFDYSEYLKAFERFKAADHFGKIVIRW